MEFFFVGRGVGPGFEVLVLKAIKAMIPAAAASPQGRAGAMREKTEGEMILDPGWRVAMVPDWNPSSSD